MVLSRGPGIPAGALAALFLVNLLALPDRAPAEPARTGASFVEEFDRLNEKRWYISDGWANGTYQNCLWSADQVSVGEGTLRLSFAERPSGERRYACAEVQSRQRFGHGVYEARMKAVAGSGFNTAFFTYIGPVHKQPWHEIDFEILGKDTSRVQLNHFVDGKGRNETLATLPGDAEAAFHDYAFVWEKNRLRFFVNGQLVHTVTDPQKLPARPMKILFSLWASETMPQWLGGFSDPGKPVSAVVARVSYTAPGDPCQYPDSLVCRLD
ncbi:glycoside hydrolase family 16 protein [Pelagibius sp.]|uniref:endo-1,3-1,4-beta-glycanase ExoK n=1 Tax=Pelagibius sp. TaxID=1931238 RepID=UPI002633C90F|nr:glycoside hydrolase family 16 protein [Pelagibius sp.]